MVLTSLVVTDALAREIFLFEMEHIPCVYKLHQNKIETKILRRQVT